MSVGEVPSTTDPVPVVVAAVNWLELLDDSTAALAGTAPPLTLTTVVASDPAVLVMSPVCAGSCAACNVPVRDVVGKPVALVNTNAVGVPKAGVTRVGDVASTLLPVPVLVAAIN